jgi:hypothetical protein
MCFLFLTSRGPCSCGFGRKEGRKEGRSDSFPQAGTKSPMYDTTKYYCVDIVLLWALVRKNLKSRSKILLETKRKTKVRHPIVLIIYIGTLSHTLQKP